MKKTLLITAVLALLVSTAASAQSVNLEVTVPFNFIVNRATLPAGEYKLTSAADAGTVLAISNLDSRTTRYVLSNACMSGKSASKTQLVFHRYGDRYFLSQIWIEGNDSGREIPQGAREKEVAKDYTMREVVLVASR